MPGDTRPIGVFDSGMGGLTVLRALCARLPNEHFVYLGDTARLPYGTKSPDTVRAYALQATHLLLSEDVKMVVIACNTASAVALDALREALAPVPVIGVIEPGARAGVAATRNKHIAVLATESTVKGAAYVHAIRRLVADAMVEQLACQVFVALAEEGWADTSVTTAAIKDYLEPLFAHPGAPDTLVLGCTHFPVLKAAIQRYVGDAITLVDSADTTAAAVAETLATSTLQTDISAAPRNIHFFATDSTERFARIGAIFFGREIDSGDVTLVDLKMV